MKMIRSLAIVLGMISLVAGTGFAVSGSLVTHTHDGSETVDHAAPMDQFGCHNGPDGVKHCH